MEIINHMKKFILFLLSILLLSFTYIKLQNEDFFYDYFKTFDEVEFCYVYKSSEKEDTASNEYVLSSGGYDFLYFFDSSSIDFSPDYYEVNFKGDEQTIKKILKDLNILVYNSENVEKRFIIYGYSSNFRKYCLVNNRKINFQIVLLNNKIMVGYPMIYSGF